MRPPLCLVALVVACSAPPPPAPVVPRLPVPLAPIDDRSDAGPPPLAFGYPYKFPPTDAGHTDAASTDGLPSAATWPYLAWDRAEAFIYNWYTGPRRPIYDQSGWSEYINARKPLDRQQARRAVALVVAGGGALQLWSCAYPRHGVVFFAGDIPVGSVSVCFSCGDVVVWPPYESWPGSTRPAPEAQRRTVRFFDAKERALRRAMDGWTHLFAHELHWWLGF